jgi:hypothetical protein
MNSVEREILACAAELDPGPAQQQRLRRIMSDDVDVDHLIDLALKEGLAGLLYKNLKKAGILENLGEQQRERLKSLYYTTVRFNLKLIHDLKEVLELLNERKIQVVLLQGIALLPQIYEDIGLRPLTDIDLWVLDRGYPELVSVLMSEGYQRDPLYPNTFRRGLTIFDINTHPLGADRIRTRTLLISKSVEQIFHETRVTHFEGQEARCLNRYDQVLFLGLHALKHSVTRLIWLVDIKGLVANWKESDWEAVVDRAQDLGQENGVGYICFLLSNIFDFHLPLEAHRLLTGEQFSFLDKKLLTQRIKGDYLPIWAPFILLSSGKTLAKRVSFFMENVFPRPEILRQVFPGSANSKVWQLYLKRVLQLMGMIRMP